MVANKPDHKQAWNDGERTGGGQHPPINTASPYRSGHDCPDWLGIYGSQRPCKQQLYPGKHEGKERRHPDSGANHWQKYLHEKLGKAVAINVGHLVILPRHTRHESFQNPDSEGHIKQTMSQSHRDMRVEQTDGRIELKEWQKENRWWRHAVTEQPEKQVLVADELVPAESVGRRQRHQKCDDYVDGYVNHRVYVPTVPARIR